MIRSCCLFLVISCLTSILIIFYLVFFDIIVCVPPLIFISEFISVSIAYSSRWFHLSLFYFAYFSIFSPSISITLIWSLLQLSYAIISLPRSILYIDWYASLLLAYFVFVDSFRNLSIFSFILLSLIFITIILSLLWPIWNDHYDCFFMVLLFSPFFDFL